MAASESKTSKAGKVKKKANLWTAASDGDMARVEELFKTGEFGPNSKDENGYTPMHAGASYGHFSMLEYLIARGGDINIGDSDGDTPLMHCDDIPTAQWLLAHGADIERTNNQGQNVVQKLLAETCENAERGIPMDADHKALTGALLVALKQHRDAQRSAVPLPVVPTDVPEVPTMSDDD